MSFWTGYLAHMLACYGWEQLLEITLLYIFKCNVNTASVFVVHTVVLWIFDNLQWHLFWINMKILRTSVNTAVCQRPTSGLLIQVQTSASTAFRILQTLWVGNLGWLLYFTWFFSVQRVCECKVGGRETHFQQAAHRFLTSRKNQPLISVQQPVMHKSGERHPAEVKLPCLDSMLSTTVQLGHFAADMFCIDWFMYMQLVINVYFIVWILKGERTKQWGCGPL